MVSGGSIKDDSDGMSEAISLSHQEKNFFFIFLFLFLFFQILLCKRIGSRIGFNPNRGSIANQTRIRFFQVGKTELTRFGLKIADMS